MNPKNILKHSISALLFTNLVIPAISLAANDGRERNLIVRQAINDAPPGSGSRREVRDNVNTVSRRGDIRNLPTPLFKRLLEMTSRPHSYLPQTAFAEADDPSQLVQYYLLDTSEFQPNIFTSKIPGINDLAIQTGANFANGGLPTIGAIRVVLEPKEGLPTDPEDPRAFLDMFTDISGLFVINNESGWYEGWMIRDIRVPEVAPPRSDGSGQAQYGKITQADADALAQMGAGNNGIPGNIFTVDGNIPRFPSANDVWPDNVNNTVPFPVSIGSFNSLQQSDAHAYWEFNAGTNWVFPHYELPFTGGVPGTFDAGLQYAFQSLVPGSGPEGITNPSEVLGDDPNNPRDPDRAEEEPGANQRETRLRFIPSGLTDEVLFNVFLRPQSFLPGVTDVAERLLRSYAQEVARIDSNNDGAISFAEADINAVSDGLPNTRLFLPPSAFNRYAITRELNDGLIAPRFAPSTRAYVASGDLVLVRPNVDASIPRDADDR
ncbi:MAG: hypothetical protein K0U68_12980 [Gammaproteobacteria bacterium]|nr:hypothetical protein [Gammaproteobacteria bacterium]